MAGQAFCPRRTSSLCWDSRRQLEKTDQKLASRDSNPDLRLYEADAIPLRHARIGAYALNKRFWTRFSVSTRLVQPILQISRCTAHADRSTGHRRTGAIHAQKRGFLMVPDESLHFLMEFPDFDQIRQKSHFLTHFETPLGELNTTALRIFRLLLARTFRKMYASNARFGPPT